MAHGHQRYRCKACGRSFTATPARGKPAAMKALAVLLYALGNVSQGMITKLLGVSHVAVYQWIRAAGEGTPPPSAAPADNIVQIDEMWHFVGGKKTRPAKLAGRVGARSRSGRLAGRGGSGNVGHGIGASARGRGEPRATGADQSGRDRVPHSGEVG
jgi:hypothetical protein